MSWNKILNHDQELIFFNYFVSMWVTSSIRGWYHGSRYVIKTSCTKTKTWANKIWAIKNKYCSHHWLVILANNNLRHQKIYTWLHWIAKIKLWIFHYLFNPATSTMSNFVPIINSGGSELCSFILGLKTWIK